MNKCTFISKRYLKGKNSRLAGSHWLSLIGIILGVSALLIILSVMNGMRDVVIERIISSSPELEIQINQDDDLQSLMQKLQTLSFIDKITPVYEEDLVILSNNKTLLTKFIGINLIEFSKNNSVLNKLSYSDNYANSPGLLYGSNDLETFSEGGAFIGYELSRNFNLNIGDVLTVISLNKSSYSSLGKIPLAYRFKVQGIYSNLIPELEMNVVYVADTKLQKLTHSKLLYNKIDIYSKDFTKANTYKKNIEAILQNNTISSWSDKNSNLYDAQRLEKNVMSFILSLIIILSSFNLSGSFLKKVSNKKKELGILTTIGYSKKDIMNIFLIQGIIIGFIGVVSGNILALSLIYIQLTFNLISMPVNIAHIFPTLPISIQTRDFILVSLFTFIFSVISSLFPIIQINRLNPIQLIKE